MGTDRHYSSANAVRPEELHALHYLQPIGHYLCTFDRSVLRAKSSWQLHVRRFRSNFHIATRKNK